MSKVTEAVWALAQPVAEELGCEVWDIEYVKEAGNYYLRIYIDKETGVSIGDCEQLSRAMDDILDEQDPIPTSYIFEVSSAGAERRLYRPSDFERFLGHTVEVKLYQSVNGEKSFIGVLSQYCDGAVTIQIEDAIHCFSKEQIAQVRLRIV